MREETYLVARDNLSRADGSNIRAAARERRAENRPACDLVAVLVEADVVPPSDTSIAG